MSHFLRKSVLFVDDEPKLLDGLRRMLRPMRESWDMEFLSSGSDAALHISRRCFDVIVSDMKMPEVDGATLLQTASDQCPSSIRMVLSGQAEVTSVLRATRVAHQYMSKPCDVEGLKRRITNAFEVRDLLGHSVVKEVLTSLVITPTIPEFFNCLRKELEQDLPSTGVLEGLVLNDPGLAAKVLQISNSAFFGPAKEISNPIEAVRALGGDALRGLFLTAEVVYPCNLSTEILSLPSVLAHSHGVIDVLERIFQIEEFSEEEKWQARMAGLLHEFGRILLATMLPEEYSRVKGLIDQECISQGEAEYEVFGVTHPEVSAYLLALWGLPKSIVEAVAYHHHPERTNGAEFNVLAALHVANVLEDELHPRSRFETKLELNGDYMSRCGRHETVAQWLEKCGLKHKR